MGTGGLLNIFYDPIGALLGAISPALGDIWTTFTKWIGIYYVVEWIAINIIEPLIKDIFGFEDQDKNIYQVAVLAHDMFDNQLYPSVQLDLALKYAKDEDVDALTYIRKFAETGDRHFGEFYRNGKWYYEDYLPTVTINGTTINVEEVTRIIQTKYKYDKIVINDIYTTAPIDEDWCKWQLINHYDYNYHANCLVYGGKYYAVSGVKYIPENNNFKVNFTPITKALRRVYETIKFISHKASDADIKEYFVRKGTIEDLEVTSRMIDTISIKTLYENIKIVDSVVEVVEVGPAKDEKFDLVYITKTNMKQYYVASSDMLFRHEEEETRYAPYEVTKDTVKPSVTQTVINEEIKGHYLKYNTVVRDTSKFLVATGKELSSSTELIGASIDIISEPIEESTEETIENETEIRTFFHTVEFNRTVSTDIHGTSLGIEEKILKENYVFATSSDEEYEDVTLTNHIQISDEEIQREVKTTEIVTLHASGGVIYNKIVTTDYDKSYIVDTGTSKDEITTKEISEEEIDIEYDETPLVLYVEHHYQHSCYSVYFNADSERHLWIYDISTDIYPNLSSTTERILNIEAYPVVLLRNNFFDVRNYKHSAIGMTSRPSCVTEHRYKTTQTVLKKVGLDIETLTDAYSKNSDVDKVQDAFFIFGISPSTQDEVVSKVLYEMFDFISDRLPYIGGEAGYSCTYKESPFNGSFVWTPKPVEITTGSIGSVGTHKHTISGSTLTLQKQLTPDSYKTITLADCSSFTLVRWDIAFGGINFSLGDSNLIIPLMVPVVERLSIVDRTKLFGKSAYLLFYCFEHQYQHLEWYQTEEFAAFLGTLLQVFVIIIVIVVTALTWWFSGPTGGLLTSAALMPLLASLAVGAGVMLCMKLIADNVQDTKLKMILSMATVAVGAVCSMGISSAFGGLTTAAMIGEIAISLVEMASIAVDAYVQDYQQRLQKQFDDLQAQMDLFQQKFQDKAKELEEKTKELNSGLKASNMVGLIDMDSFDMERDSIVSASLMSPTQFFYASIDLYRNYDVLYTGMYDQAVHRFCQDRLDIGVNPY